MSPNFLHIRLSIAVLLSALFLFAAACGTTNNTGTSSNEPSTSSGTTPSTPAPTKEPETKAPDFPTQPVRLIITHAAGGSIDNVIRILHPFLEEELGQPVVVENMTGAGGNVSRAFVYKQKPDGYTLLASQFPSMMIGQITQNGDFDTREMTPIFQVTGRQTQALIVKGDSPWKSFEDVVEASKSTRLTVAGPGLGSNGQLSYALYADAGIQADYVPFDSGPEAITAVAGGQTNLAVADSVSLPDLVANNTVRPLAVASPEEDHNSPGAPTLRQLGFEDNAFEISVGIIGPPDIPADIVEILANAFDKAVNNPEFVEKAKNANYTPSPLNPAEFKQSIDSGFQLVEKFKDLLMAPSNK